jgi:flagellar hook assembly protein FlgD
VQARVLNIAGRPVRTLCTAKACDPGAGTLLWNGQSDHGLAAPNGLYVVEVVAKATDGSQAMALAQVRMDR